MLSHMPTHVKLLCEKYNIQCSYNPRTDRVRVVYTPNSKGPTFEESELFRLFLESKNLGIGIEQVVLGVDMTFTNNPVPQFPDYMERIRLISFEYSLVQYHDRIRNELVVDRRRNTDKPLTDEEKQICEDYLRPMCGSGTKIIWRT